MMPGLTYASPSIATAGHEPPPQRTASGPGRAVDELRATVTGEAAEGEGGTFRLRTRWPSADQLDYVNKLATAGLLLLALLLLAAAAVRQPGRAFGLLVTAVGARVGVRP